MSELKSLIKRIRLYSFLLFLVPLIALFGSLLITNQLSQYGFSYMPFGKAEPSVTECNKDNTYCFDIIKRVKFHECSQFILTPEYHVNGKLISMHDHVLSDVLGNKSRLLTTNEIKALEEFKDIKLKVFFEHKDKKVDYSCIKNSVLYPIYENLPFMGELFAKLSNIYKPGTAGIVYPFLYGETSISNIVKRVPVSFLFKPLLYLSSIFMILYWINYKRILSKIEKTNNVKKNEFFLIFGILSSIFLFLHVIFLGVDIDSSIFKKFRRLIIILFILFELMAQFFLAKKIFKLKNILFNYTYRILIYLKVIFVAIILLLTIITISILIIFDPGSAFNNILEWNYFVFLLFFYFLSAILWRRKPPVHTPEGM